MFWLLALVIVLGGLAVGSLAAWFSHGYEEDTETETAVWSPPRCGHCHEELALASTTFAWWRSGLRCPHCGERASIAWLAITLAVPAFGLVMLATWGARAVLVPFLWLVPVLVVAAAVDIRLMLIPRKVAWWGAGVGWHQPDARAVLVRVGVDRRDDERGLRPIGRHLGIADEAQVEEIALGDQLVLGDGHTPVPFVLPVQ